MFCTRIYDSVIDLPPHPLNALKDQQSKHKSDPQEAEEPMKHLKSIKTRYPSLSSPDLGMSESPIEKTPILHVVTVNELEHFDGDATLGIGYHHTQHMLGCNSYKRYISKGEWEGPTLRLRFFALRSQLVKSIGNFGPLKLKDFSEISCP